MSSDVITQGIIAPLKWDPLPEEQIEDLRERFYTEGTNLGINYEGTLVYIAESDDDPYQLWFSDLEGVPSRSLEEFAAKAIVYGCEVDFSRARRFRCLWYNGADAPFDMLTREQFLKDTTG